MTRHTIQFLILIVAPCISCRAAELRFAKLFTDHCVLQCEMSVPVWGWAEPDSEVTLKFAGQSKSVMSDGDGKWLLQLDRMQASREPRHLTVSSTDQSVTLKDVHVGEVWLCSGCAAGHCREVRSMMFHPCPLDSENQNPLSRRFSLCGIRPSSRQRALRDDSRHIEKRDVWRNATKQ